MKESITIEGLIKIVRKVSTIQIFGTALTKQNSIQEEIKSRLKSGNACCHSVQNILSSGWLSKNIKITIYRTIILPVVLYGCKTWSPSLREEHKLMVLENKVLKRIFGRGNRGLEKTT